MYICTTAGNIELQHPVQSFISEITKIVFLSFFWQPYNKTRKFQAVRFYFIQGFRLDRLLDDNLGYFSTFLGQNILNVYSLILLWRGDSNEYPLTYIFGEIL